MAEYSRPQSEAEFEANFAQLKPLMNDTEAYYESSRCLFCYDAPCMNACPTGIDIPLFIRQIHTQDLEGAAKTIYDKNWFGYACGKVCPTEVLCEGACVYNHQNVKPIEIGRLQSVATGHVIAGDKKIYNLPESNGKKVAIVGAGPAGLATACELRLLGYEVDVFEAKEKPSGLTVYGVAPYKITNEEALVEMDYLERQMGYKVHYSSAVDAAKLKEIEENYDAAFLGIGLGETWEPKMDGVELESVVGATEFIEELRMQHHKISIPENVVVVGGGNTAMDAASESARLGAKNVALVYRRAKEDMGAYEFEYDLAKGVGVKGVFNASPVRVLGKENVEGIEFIKTEVVDGKLQNIAGSEFSIPCKMVILATGQTKQKGFLSQIDGMELDRRGCMTVNEYGQTSNPFYFAGGDAVNGGAEVVNGAAEGKVAAHGIHKFITGA